MGGAWCAHVILSGATGSSPNMIPCVNCVEFKMEDHR